MFIIVESYRSFEGDFNINIGHTIDEEFAKKYVEKLNKENEQIQNEIKLFYANILPKWDKEHPCPVENKKNGENYQTKFTEWLDLRSQFVLKNCPQSKYDNNTSWSYEKSILLEQSSVNLNNIVKLNEDNTISHSDFCELGHIIGSNYDEISNEICYNKFYGQDGNQFIEVYRIWPGCEFDEDGKAYSHSSSEKINQLVEEIFKQNNRISSFKILN